MATSLRAVLTLFGITIFSSAAIPQSNGDISSVVDLTRLVEHTSADGAVLAWDQSAYDALNVPAMSAGAAFNDPVTGVRTVKLTDENTDVVNRDWVTMYSTLGLAISRPWGPDLDQYTIAFHGFLNNNSIALLCDYQLGGTTSNYRPAPDGEGQMAFARSDGNAQIIYYVTGTHLNRYDTATDSLANSGIFPIAWSTDNNANAWLNTNNDDTWAVAHDGGASNSIATALNMVTGAVLTRPAHPGQNEPYMGSGHTVFLNKGENYPPLTVLDEHWDLETNTVTRLNIPFGGIDPAVDWGGVSHAAVPFGDFVYHIDVSHGNGDWPSVLIGSDNTYSTPVDITGYWSDTHSTGYWWDLPAGIDPQVLMSHDSDPGTFDEPTWESTLMFVNTLTGSKRILGHHYSINPSGITSPGYTNPIKYYDEAHAHISHDGKLVIYTSSMNQTNRHDVFLMEVPRVPIGPRPRPPTLD